MGDNDSKRSTRFATACTLEYLPHDWSSPTRKWPFVSKSLHTPCEYKILVHEELDYFINHIGHCTSDCGGRKEQWHGCPFFRFWRCCLEDDSKSRRSRWHQGGYNQADDHESHKSKKAFGSRGGLTPCDEARSHSFHELCNGFRLVGSASKSKKKQNGLVAIGRYPPSHLCSRFAATHQQSGALLLIHGNDRARDRDDFLIGMSNSVGCMLQG
mmetsp:Transcript_1964/g.3572  ORF Transcript_1964/g.3572 Transcript_1964/m.3572 type:complete len:213 (-) Transcript_1964:189-827(-)